MTTTAQQLIEAAYARSTASDAGKLAVDGEMLVHLNRTYQNTFARYSQASGDNALASISTTWAGAPAIISLPTDIVDIVLLQNAAGQTVRLIPAREINRTWHLAPACIRVSNTLQTRGALAGAFGALADPIAGDAVRMFYKDSPATLSALGSTLDARYPVRFEHLLIADLALYLWSKDEGRPADRGQELMAELQRQEAYFVSIVGPSNTARESAHTGSAPDSSRTK